MSSSTQNHEQFLYDGRRELACTSSFLLHLSVHFLKILSNFFCQIQTKVILQHQDAILHLATIPRSAFRMVAFKLFLISKGHICQNIFCSMCWPGSCVPDLCICDSEKTYLSSKGCLECIWGGESFKQAATTDSHLKKHLL